MGLLDDAKKAAGNDKIENVSDSVIGKVGDTVSEKTGGKYDGQVDKATHVADEKIGD